MSTGGPRYMRTFYLRFCVYAFIIVISEERILQLTNAIGLIICEIRYARANFLGPYLSHITSAACIL